MAHALLDDIDDAIAQARASPLAERPGPFKIMKVPVHRVHQFHDALTLGRDRTQHGWRPRGWRLGTRCATRSACRIEVHTVMRGHILQRRAGAQTQHELQVVAQLVRAGTVGFVDDEQIGDFHQSGFQRLNRIAGFRNENDHTRIGGARDIELRLTHANRLDQDAIEPERVEDVGDLAGRRGQSAE